MDGLQLNTSQARWQHTCSYLGQYAKFPNVAFGILWNDLQLAIFSIYLPSSFPSEVANVWPAQEKAHLLKYCHPFRPGFATQNLVTGGMFGGRSYRSSQKVARRMNSCHELPVSGEMLQYRNNGTGAQQNRRVDAFANKTWLARICQKQLQDEVATTYFMDNEPQWSSIPLSCHPLIQRRPWDVSETVCRHGLNDDSPAQMMFFQNREPQSWLVG